MHDPMTVASPAPRRPVVVKIGGAALEDPATRGVVVGRLADLHRRGERLVVVHGGGGEVDRLVTRLGMTTDRRDGIRITPPDQMEIVAGVLAGRVNTDLVAGLVAEGVPAMGLTLCDGGLARCRVATGLGFDPGRVGEIVDGDPRAIETLGDAGFLPVVASIGCDERGELLNVNADIAAAGIAAIVHARELMLLTDVPGVQGADGSIRADLDRVVIEAGIAEGWIHGGMVPKVRGGLAVADSIGIPVRIAGWGSDETGTRIVPSTTDAAAPTPSSAPARSAGP